MEIDITAFVTHADPFEFSRSIAEAGDRAGPDSWRNALQEADRAPLLTTEEHFDALRHWAKDTGAWNEEERTAWSDDECNALFIQLISGNIRECGLDDVPLDEFDWQEYEQQCQEGRFSSCLFKGIDDRIYYSLD